MNQTVKGMTAAIYAQILVHKDVPSQGKYAIFDEQTTQQINFASLYQHIHTLFRRAQVEPECIVAAVQYLDKFQERGCQLTRHNIYRLTFTAIVVASKTWDDISCTSKSFAQCAKGFTRQQLNQMERVFVGTLNFELFLDAHDYKQYYYTLKNIWTRLECDNDYNIVGWIDRPCNGPADQHRWCVWGINNLANLPTRDVTQQQPVLCIDDL